MKRQAGLSLIELVISIVVLAVAAVGIFSAIGSIVSRSADPLIRQQSIAIAEAYIEEIQSMAFGLPGSCPAVPGGGGRADYNAVCHYDGLTDNGAVDQNGNAILALADYDVSVAITSSSGLGGISAGNVARIDVSVTGPTNETVLMTAYRTNY
jgi:MSHA pilin protein MshD